MRPPTTMTRWMMVLAAFGAISLSVLNPTSAHAEGTFVSAPSRQDVVYDDSRGLLYITAGDRVLRYDPFARTLLEPYVVGGTLAGIDIAPDYSLLAVADTSSDNTATPHVDGGDMWMHTIDLENGRVQTHTAPRVSYELGTWMVAFGDDGRVLASSTRSGSGDTRIRRLDPQTGSFETVRGVRMKTVLAASGDRGIIGFAQGNTTAGDWGRYRVSDMSWVHRNSSDFNGTNELQCDMSLNADGTQYAILSYQDFPTDKVMIHDSAYARTHTIEGANGLEYSPTSNVLYVASVDSTKVTAYETVNYTKLAEYDFETPFDRWSWPGPFNRPRMAVSRDNSMLFSTVEDGVRSVPLKPQVTGRVVAAGDESPMSDSMVEVYRRAGGRWSLESTRPVGEGGGWGYSADSDVVVKLRVIDPTGVRTPVWVGGYSLESATTYTASRKGPPFVDIRVSAVSGGSIAGVVTAPGTTRPAMGASVRLYSAAGMLLATTTTAQDGGYEFTGVPAGDYKVGFVHRMYGQCFFGGGKSLAGSPTVGVTSGSTTELSQQLPPRTFVRPRRR